MAKLQICGMFHLRWILGCVLMAMCSSHLAKADPCFNNPLIATDSFCMAPMLANVWGAGSGGIGSVASGDPFALSFPFFMAFSFTLPKDVSAETWLVLRPPCVREGDADCKEVSHVADFGVGTRPPPQDLYRIFDSNLAWASTLSYPFYGTANFVWTDFVQFDNKTDKTIDITLHWNIAYLLFTSGIFSEASFSADYSLGPTNQPLLKKIPFFPPVDCKNGQGNFLPPCFDVLSGNVSLALAPGKDTLRIEDPDYATAAESTSTVPEPCTLSFYCTGLAAVLIRRVCRRGGCR